MKIILILMLFISSFAWGVESSAQKNECVGRLEFSVPESIEYALLPVRGLYDREYGLYRFEENNGTYRMSFYFDGGFSITEEISESDIPKATEYGYPDSTNIDKHNFIRQFSAELQSNPTKLGFGILYDKVGVVAKYEKRIYMHILPVPNDELGDLTKEEYLAHKKDVFLKNFRTRTMYEIPTGNGVCMPFAFVADDGSTPREMEATFQLVDHPDVTVSISDANANNDAKTQSERESIEPKEMSVDFWKSTFSFSREIHLGFPMWHSLKMNGQKGIWSLGRYNNKDMSEDVAFMAIVLGDKEKNTPDIRVVIDRDFRKAKGEPMSASQIETLGKSIAASIRIRQ